MAHKQEIEACRPPNEALIHRIAKELQRTGLRCVFEFGPGSGDGPFQFVISADGVPEIIPDVYALVAAAPSIDGWKIVQFRQPEPNPTEVKLEMSGRTISPSSILVQYRFDDILRVFHIVLFFDGYTKKDQKIHMMIANILMDITIGELETIRLIGTVHFEPILAPSKTNISLVEFAKVVHEKRDQFIATGGVFR